MLDMMQVFAWLHNGAFATPLCRPVRSGPGRLPGSRWSWKVIVSWEGDWYNGVDGDNRDKVRIYHS
jgi:hypothetical protein